MLLHRLPEFRLVVIYHLWGIYRIYSCWKTGSERLSKLRGNSKLLKHFRPAILFKANRRINVASK